MKFHFTLMSQSLRIRVPLLKLQIREGFVCVGNKSLRQVEESIHLFVLVDSGLVSSIGVRYTSYLRLAVNRGSQGADTTAYSTPFPASFPSGSWVGYGRGVRSY